MIDTSYAEARATVELAVLGGIRPPRAGPPRERARTVNEGRVAYVIGFSAPPVLQLGDFIRLLQPHEWDTYVILSPTAATWVDVKTLAELSGHPVRVEPRMPTDQDPLPTPDAVFAAPITFNSLNKWAAGISDTLALGLLNEALGLDAPIFAAPCVNEALRRHPNLSTATAVRRVVRG